MKKKPKMTKKESDRKLEGLLEKWGKENGKRKKLARKD